jgi:hypothetical protein
LKAKSSDLIDRLEAESNMEHKIDTVLPVKWNASNKTGQSTDIAIKNCFQELKKFYDDFELSQHDGELLYSSIQDRSKISWILFLQKMLFAS